MLPLPTTIGKEGVIGMEIGDFLAQKPSISEILLYVDEQAKKIVEIRKKETVEATKEK